MHTAIAASTFKPLLRSSQSALFFSSQARILCACWSSRLQRCSSSAAPCVDSQSVKIQQHANSLASSNPRNGLSSQKQDSRVITRARRTAFRELQDIREESNAASASDLEYDSPLKVVLYPDPRLRKKNKRITVFDEKLEKFVREMFEVMYETDGVGLSAPQVGVNVQLMVFNPEGEKGKGEEIVLVNPKIYKYANRRSLYTEGCLSFPEMEGDVERPVSVKIEAQDIKGKKFDIHLKGFQARIFQHEYDHLQSVLFFERMAPDVLATIIPTLQKLERDYEQRTGKPAPEKVKTNVKK